MPLQHRHKLIVGLVLVGLMFAASAVAVWFLPPNIPVRWTLPGLDAEASGRLEALFLIPLFALMLTTMFWLLPYAASRMTPEVIRGADGAFAVAAALMLFAHGTILVAATRGKVQMVAETIWIGVYLFFMAVARMIRDLPQGHPLGYRLPWTMSDAEIWAATHRMAWLVMSVCGVAAIGLTLMAKRELEVLYTYAALVFAIPIFYAWQLSAHRDDGEDDADEVAPGGDRQLVTSESRSEATF